MALKMSFLVWVDIIQFQTGALVGDFLFSVIFLNLRQIEPLKYLNADVMMLPYAIFYLFTVMTP